MNYTLNIRGRLVDLKEPLVMGILNITPDSFYDASRQQTEQDVARRAHEIVNQGGAIIDVGACSTRPGGEPVDEEEEMRRLRLALSVVRREQPEAIVSVDTFRANVARMAVEEFGADIVNDVTEAADQSMLRMVARLRVPYILTSVQSNLHDTLMAFAQKVQMMRDLGQNDIILDPGFGFGKTTAENFQLFNEMEKMLVMELPLLVGISRKSMIYKTLSCTPTEAQNGTTMLNTVALMKGASILRVHDVKEAVECCRLFAALTLQTEANQTENR